MMGALRLTSRIIIGLVFTFSGFVKCVDPLGTAIKFGDYLQAFEMDFLVALSLPAAVLMCAIELCIGLMLLLNIKIPWATWMTVIFMAGFTPLTLFLAIKNPVSDCGCFGDALILTNWQTFYKNIVIDIFVVILLINRNKYKELFKGSGGLIATAAVFIVVIGFEIFSLNRLPIIDFRPYKIGENISEGMIFPEGAQEPIFETSLIYEKDGVQKEFTIDNYPQTDDWTFVDQKTKVIEKGYEPPIHDFSISLDDGDYTDEILADPNFTFLLISHHIDKASLKNQGKINEIAEKMMNMGIRFICLSSSGSDQKQEFKEESGAPYNFGFTDETTLKTIIRSNPGLVLIKEGDIIDKWHHKHLPDLDELMELMDSSSY